ncbi:DNA-directed RNA polymerase subunit N [Fadolivirus algeromassiliense]|jgi:DNA-directed RNA polymerase subunit N (RpoN/RPB10)|uniref:DNA-directed RNA polymerase subunit N n=1 Tax=Fadolivirus FV1/VV64 TaxID=3070911 RepID=A0A7D3QU14_9VIRU|nr:DNA-directed RNA polymerase subunit N [Fadolivirus algeromassiliense]QKF93787.1 DNA-directed RNA polymerase subunit N [Fadolivirus FV1/VV64]
MLYFRCPSCKTLLANKQLIYEQRLDNICKNDKLSTKDKDNAKSKLLDELELHRSCCRMRMMGYISLVNIIK